MISFLVIHTNATTRTGVKYFFNALKRIKLVTIDIYVKACQDWTEMEKRTLTLRWKCGVMNVLLCGDMEVWTVKESENENNDFEVPCGVTSVWKTQRRSNSRLRSADQSELPPFNSEGFWMLFVGWYWKWDDGQYLKFFQALFGTLACPHVNVHSIG